MAIDEDLRAIVRKRRTQSRCAKCGARAGKATLCGRCAPDWRYCPSCEQVFAIALASASERSPARPSAYCPPCGRLVRNGPREPRESYVARMRAKEHPLLPTIRRHYRRGLSYRAIAVELGIPKGTLCSIVAHARKTGRWPSSLHRP